MSKIDIRCLDKATLVYRLWCCAKRSPYLRDYDKDIHLDIQNIKNDLMTMQANNEPCIFTIYYGKVLLVDVTCDNMDARDYDFYNGKNKAANIILDIKTRELYNVLAFLAKYG